MRVGIAQIDSRIGDFSGNVRRIVRAAEIAGAAGAELCVMPELVVTGYPPRDLLFDPRFVASAASTVDAIAAQTAGGMPVLVGSVVAAGPGRPGHPGLWDAALLLEGGQVRQVIAKRLLPSYDVFHETRWFVPGPRSRVLDLAGRKVGVLICEDLWDEGYPLSPGAELEAAGAQLLICRWCTPTRAAPTTSWSSMAAASSPRAGAWSPGCHVSPRPCRWSTPAPHQVPKQAATASTTCSQP
ncbi:MAG: hypothetical protein L6Q84_06705 [Polyangiaceae bacterium]|nr:hypothetical protein [Polyangiaceae bacterium]